MESFWDEDLSVAIERYIIIDAASGEVTRYASSTQAYENDELVEILKKVGFHKPEFFPSLRGKPDDKMSQLQVLVAQK